MRLTNRMKFVSIKNTLHPYRLAKIAILFSIEIIKIEIGNCIKSSVNVIVKIQVVIRITRDLIDSVKISKALGRLNNLPQLSLKIQAINLQLCEARIKIYFLRCEF